MGEWVGERGSLRVWSLVVWSDKEKERGTVSWAFVVVIVVIVRSTLCFVLWSVIFLLITMSDTKRGMGCRIGQCYYGQRRSVIVEEKKRS
jgi:hypothetical protein